MAYLMFLTLAIRPACYCWVSRISQLYDRVYVKVLKVEKLYSDSSAQQLFEVVAPSSGERVADGMMRDEALHDVKLLFSRGGRVFGLARVSCPFKCGLADTESCFLTKVTSGEQGWVYWYMIGRDDECRDVMNRLSDRGVEFRVLEMRKLEGERSLTGKQELIVKAALDLGYFDYPKRISIRELADMFGVTPATVTETLRKGVKKILTEYFNSIGEIKLRGEYERMLDTLIP